MLRVALRLMGVVLTCAIVFFLAREFGEEPGASTALVLTLFGSVSFFFASELSSVLLPGYGLTTTTYSPAMAFRILGVVIECVALGCLFFWR